MTGFPKGLPFACLLLALSCGGPKRYEPSARPDAAPLRVWIDPGSGLPEDAILSGCQAWKDKGVTCSLVADRSVSHIQVYADREDPCATNKKGLRTLARAWKGGRVVFYAKCFTKKGVLDARMLRAVGVHEVGHQLGIWGHVPVDCGSEDAKTHPSGKKVCGTAVMNPLYDKDVDFMTPIDALAFDLRDRRIGVVIDVFEGGETRDPDCDYRQ